jgi:hypothetical protein
LIPISPTMFEPLSIASANLSARFKEPSQARNQFTAQLKRTSAEKIHVLQPPPTR